MCYLSVFAVLLLSCYISLSFCFFVKFCYFVKFFLVDFSNCDRFVVFINIMEPRPGPSREPDQPDRAQELDFLSPRKKRPRGALMPKEKHIILNIYKYNIENWPKTTEWSAKECAKKTSEMTGVSLASVYRITKEYKETKEFQQPKKPGPQRSFIQKFDEFTFAAIRRKVHAFFYKNEIPTIEKVLLSPLDADSHDFKTIMLLIYILTVM